MLTVELKGQAVLVTGASRGLGRAIAKTLAQAGADLVLAGRDAGALAETEREVTSLGVRAVTAVADVSREADIDRLIESAAAAFGRLDVLVNNAGISGDPKPFLETTAADWDAVLAVNLRGPALLARAAARRMVAQGGGHIINVASIGALKPLGHLAPYCASKAALVQLTKVMALELARRNVRVNVVCPGYVLTDMNRAFFETDAGRKLVERIPLRRLGRPEEIGRAVTQLAAETTGFTTGSVVVVDGGHLIG